MKISPVINFLNYKYNSPSYGLKLKPLQYDTVSFGRQKSPTPKEQITSLEDNAFPSIGLKNYMLQGLNSTDKTIIELHKEYYSPLLDCKTLDEAKEIFPEFLGVINSTTIDVSKTGSSSIFRKIQKGKFEGLNMQNLSLEFLKRYYGELYSVQDEEKFFGFPQSSTSKMLDALNIKMDKNYLKAITAQRLSEFHTEQWLDDDFRERQSKSSLELWQQDAFRQKQSASRKRRWQDPLHRQKMSVIRKQTWENPEYRERATEIRRKTGEREDFKQLISEISKKRWQDPEFKEAFSQMLKKRWQDPEYREQMIAANKKMREDPRYIACMKIVALARQEAWERHPEFKEAYKQTAKDFKGLQDILAKVSKGTPLTAHESGYRLTYYKKCNELYPEIPTVIGETQKEVLEEWGFYDMELDDYIGLLDKIESEILC